MKPNYKRENLEKAVIQAITKEFCLQLRTIMGDRVFREMVGEHINQDAVSLPFCVSEEYCDATSAMIDALEKVLKTTWNSHLHQQYFDDAWKLAKETNFNTLKPPN
jgi:hypothetical protein